MKQHFRDDERGKRAAFYFLPWHFNFFSRYRWAGSTSLFALSRPLEL